MAPNAPRDGIRPNPLGDWPQIDPTAFVDPSAQIMGNVQIGPKSKTSSRPAPSSATAISSSTPKGYPRALAPTTSPVAARTNGALEGYTFLR
jgi:hypothetical protein